MECGCKKECDSKPKLCFPHYVVPTKFDARRFPNALVEVEEDNAVYMTDKDGFPMLTYKRIVEDDNHEPVKGKYRSTLVFDKNGPAMYFYNRDGRAFYMFAEEVGL